MVVTVASLPRPHGACTCFQTDGSRRAVRPPGARPRTFLAWVGVSSGSGLGQEPGLDPLNVGPCTCGACGAATRGSLSVCWGPLVSEESKRKCVNCGSNAVAARASVPIESRSTLHSPLLSTDTFEMRSDGRDRVGPEEAARRGSGDHRLALWQRPESH